MAASQQMQQFGMEVVVLEARVRILLLEMLKIKAQKEYKIFNKLMQLLNSLVAHRELFDVHALFPYESCFLYNHFYSQFM